VSWIPGHRGYADIRVDRGRQHRCCWGWRGSSRV
jgi:hypothetical protein